MGKGRLEAFSDGVIAIIITIMVLELKIPKSADAHVLAELVPTFASYVLSFVFVGVYWNNHHHLVHAVKRVRGRIMWANMHLLFWLSIIPFATGWLGEHPREAIPTALYGVVLILSGIAYSVLQRVILLDHDPDTHATKVLARDAKGRISLLLYAVAIGLAFVQTLASDVLYVVVALIWVVPDRILEEVDAGG